MAAALISVSVPTSAAIGAEPAVCGRRVRVVPVAALAIKGRDSLGNIVTKHAVDRIVNERKSAAAEDKDAEAGK